MKRLCCFISGLLVVSALTCVGTRLVVAQETAAPSPEPKTRERVTFEPLTHEQIDYFFDSLRAQSVYQLPPLHVSQKVSSNVAGIWAGSGMQAQSDIGEILLRFRPSVEARLTRQSSPGKGTVLAEQFDIRLQVAGKGLLIGHPLAVEGGARAGLVAPLSSTKRYPTRTTYVEAARDAGMYFSFPSLLSDEAQRGWALLLCPRVATFVPNRRTGSTDFQLLSSPYELSEVKFSITANAMSRIETAGKKERLATKLMVSEQLPETLGGSDELYALTPNLGILYRPVSAFDFFRFAPKESIQEGLLFSTEMENPVGHIRRDFYSQTLYIQKINEPAPIPVVAQGIRAVKDSGPCYVVLSQKTQWNEYDKKEPIGG